MKYLITLRKAKTSVPPYLPLSTGLSDPDSPHSEQILTYIYTSDSILYNLNLIECGAHNRLILTMAVLTLHIQFGGGLRGWGICNHKRLDTMIQRPSGPRYHSVMVIIKFNAPIN